MSSPAMHWDRLNRALIALRGRALGAVDEARPWLRREAWTRENLGSAVARWRRNPKRALTRGGLLLLLVLPFWINYLMRMLAWINLLSPDGWGTRVLHAISIDQLFINLGLLSSEGGWLEGQPATVVIALIYGYIPFLIIPLFAALDRIDQRHIEAARDLGASPFSAFRRVTLPLSMPGILAGVVLIALPMFGDYYTADLVSASTKTSMIGNQIDQLTRQGSEKVVGAVLTILISWVFLHTLFTIHYAHHFYGGADEESGLKFPDGIDEPGYWDFLYFSFTIGVAAQTADVAVSSTSMRKLTLLHAVLSFLFNTTILALAINVGASLL